MPAIFRLQANFLFRSQTSCWELLLTYLYAYIVKMRLWCLNWWVDVLKMAHQAAFSSLVGKVPMLVSFSLL